jgi:hypothetical protein
MVILDGRRLCGRKLAFTVPWTREDAEFFLKVTKNPHFAYDVTVEGEVA